VRSSMCFQCVIPERPARSEALNSAGVSPIGVTTPLPVTTTRRRSSRRPFLLMSTDNPPRGSACSLGSSAKSLYITSLSPRRIAYQTNNRDLGSGRRRHPRLERSRVEKPAADVPVSRYHFTVTAAPLVNPTLGTMPSCRRALPISQSQCPAASRTFPREKYPGRPVNHAQASAPVAKARRIGTGIRHAPRGNRHRRKPRDPAEPSGVPDEAADLVALGE
jgi:hypothetical protein